MLDFSVCVINEQIHSLTLLFHVKMSQTFWSAAENPPQLDPNSCRDFRQRPWFLTVTRPDEGSPNDVGQSWSDHRSCLIEGRGQPSHLVWCEHRAHPHVHETQPEDKTRFGAQTPKTTNKSIQV